MGTPTKLGKYELDATPLGQGAMGVVCKGYDPDLRQAVAIKVIRRELLEGPGGEQARLRFKNEAIAGRRLRHPNIVPVYEYGEDQDCSYIVMAFVEGRPLKEALDTGPRSSVSEALAITGQLLDALQHAHSNNVVHRDIKPANILVGEDGQLQIADFGIAKIDLVGLTRTGAVMGTPGYMSPEQCLGTPSDHRADIFAAGVILYQLLTGEQPFRAIAALAVMHQVLTVDPVRPSQINLDVSPALDAVVAKSMAKRREERFQSAREFAEALKEAAKPRPALAEDIRSMPTIKDPVFEGQDQAPPRTPPEPPSETPPEPPSNKGSVIGRSWLAAAVSAVAAVGLIAFLVGKEDVPPMGGSAPPAGNGGVSAPASKTVAAEPKNDRTPIPGTAVATGPGPSPGTFFRDKLKDGSEGPAMVVVPAGRFRMGDIRGEGKSGEQPVHEVVLNAPFALGQFEVTVGEFRRFVESSVYRTEAERGDGCFSWATLSRSKDVSWRTPGFEQDDRHPVVCVTWNDAQAYVQWLSEQTGYAYRLPTEAEWEYAARAGTETSYWWGDDIGKNQANCNGCGGRWDNKSTAPAGSFVANPFKIHDTVGNTGEWVEDCGHGGYDGAPVDGSAWTAGGDCAQRVLRGGSWTFVPRAVRAAFRDWLTAGVRGLNLGFRLARTL
jgi:formylglycine-generating enzyme required for sulfatase activity/predicted Ser/Thr protein kinase